MIIAWPWQVVLYNRLLPIGMQTTDATRMATLGDIQAALIKSKPIDWRPQVFSQERAFAVMSNGPDAPAWGRPAKWQSRFSKIYLTRFIKSQAGGK